MFDSSTGCGECSPACRPGLPFRVFGANKALHEQGFPVTYFCFNRTLACRTYLGSRKAGGSNCKHSGGLKLFPAPRQTHARGLMVASHVLK